MFVKLMGAIYHRYIFPFGIWGIVKAGELTAMTVKSAVKAGSNTAARRSAL